MVTCATISYVSTYNIVCYDIVCQNIQYRITTSYPRTIHYRKTGRTLTSAQLEGLAKGRETRRRNIAAKKGKSGSALYAAGYR